MGERSATTGEICLSTDMFISQKYNFRSPQTLPDYWKRQNACHVKLYMVDNERTTLKSVACMIATSQKKDRSLTKGLCQRRNYLLLLKYLIVCSGRLGEKAARRSTCVKDETGNYITDCRFNQLTSTSIHFYPLLYELPSYYKFVSQ